jgi:hypothetical protein
MLFGGVYSERLTENAVPDVLATARRALRRLGLVPHRPEIFAEPGELEAQAQVLEPA